MSTENNPIIIANLEGIWRKDGPEDELHGYKWDEIVSLFGAKEDYVTEHPVYLALDDESGNFIELYEDWEGFGEAVNFINKYLPNIEHDWFSKVKSLTPGAEGIDVWKRS